MNYILLKDMPDMKKGTILAESVKYPNRFWPALDYCLNSGEVLFKDLRGFTRAVIENNPEWFQAVNEFPTEKDALDRAAERIHGLWTDGCYLKVDEIVNILKEEIRK